MTKTDIEYVVSETLKAQKKNAMSLQSWVKLIVMVVFVPLITVYSTIKVNDWRLSEIEKDVEKINTTYVDQVWYERYIIGQQKLINRIEQDAVNRDSKLSEEISEVKEYLDKLVKEKKLYFRDET